MNSAFRLGSDGIYRCEAFERFTWQEHGFGTRLANPQAQIVLKQIHSDRVWNANGLDRGGQEGDALIVDEPGKSIGVRTADCVPILLLDSKKRAVGAVHAGWRGTAAEIVKRSLESMSAAFDTAAGDVYAAIGPCVRSCCYEVGSDVASRFTAWFPEWGEANRAKRHLDLGEANRRQILAAGIAEEHVFDSGFCTSCQGDTFFSYRREPDNPGRMIAAIGRLV